MRGMEELFVDFVANQDFAAYLLDRVTDVRVGQARFYAAEDVDVLVLLPDGSSAYTRDGSFQINAQGEMVTNAGYPVQPGLQLPEGAQSITIGADGRFTDSIDYTAGTHALRFIAKTAAGAESAETRTVTVSFTAAVVTISELR